MTEKKTKILLWSAVVVSLVCLVVVLARPAKTIVQQIKGETTTVGSLAGPDIPYNYLCVGGLCTYEYSIPLKAATVTPAYLRNPTGATSTIEFVGLYISKASSTTATPVFDIATSTSCGATSTDPIISGFIPSGESGLWWNWHATSAPSEYSGSGTPTSLGFYDNILRKNECITMKMGSTSPYTYEGTMQVILRALR